MWTISWLCWTTNLDPGSFSDVNYFLTLLNNGLRPKILQRCELFLGLDRNRVSRTQTTEIELSRTRTTEIEILEELLLVLEQQYLAQYSVLNFSSRNSSSSELLHPGSLYWIVAARLAEWNEIDKSIVISFIPTSSIGTGKQNRIQQDPIGIEQESNRIYQQGIQQQDSILGKHIVRDELSETKYIYGSL